MIKVAGKFELTEEEEKEFEKQEIIMLDTIDDFCTKSLSSLKWKNGKNAKEYLENIIKQAKQYQEQLLHYESDVKEKFKSNNIWCHHSFFEFKERVGDLEYNAGILSRLNGLISKCEDRLNNHLPKDETTTVCDVLRIQAIIDGSFLRNLTDFGYKNDKDFVEAETFNKKMIIQQSFLLGLSKEEFEDFLHCVQGSLKYKSRNIEFVEIECKFIQYIKYSYQQDKTLFDSSKKQATRKKIKEMIKIYHEREKYKDVITDHYQEGTLYENI